jgi:transposase
LADHVGVCAAALLPLNELIKAHVFAAERIHGDEKTVPVLAKVKTRTGRVWTYVRDDQPFTGIDPPAAVYFYSADWRDSARFCTTADTNLIQARGGLDPVGETPRISTP